MRDTKKTIKSHLLRLFILCLFKNYLDSSQVEKRGWACLYFWWFHVSTDSMDHDDLRKNKEKKTKRKGEMRRVKDAQTSEGIGSE